MDGGGGDGYFQDAVHQRKSRSPKRVPPIVIVSGDEESDRDDDVEEVEEDPHTAEGGDREKYFKPSRSNEGTNGAASRKHKRAKYQVHELVKKKEIERL